MTTFSILHIDSPLGILRLRGLESALCSIEFTEEKTAEVEPTKLEKAATQLGEFFRKERTSFDLPIVPNGTHFQLNVWEELMKIPYGMTWSYSDLARRLGDIKVIRAAAGANGRNPLPIVIPCHRVVGSDGTLTGYSGGLWRKKFLLDLEQSDISPKLL